MPDDALLNPSDSPFDSIRRQRHDGTEYWTSRDLQPLLGYMKWQDFQAAIQRARVAAGNAGVEVGAHFMGVHKISSSGPSAADHELTRYACYLVAMNGDPRKPEIAAAQTYFAVKTREAEVFVTQARQLPRNFVEALRELASEVEARELAEARAAENELDAARARQTLDAVGVSLVRTVAKRFGIQEKALREFMYAEKLIIRGGACHNEPMAQYVKSGHFEVKTRRIESSPDLPAEMKNTTYVTPKGEALIWKRLYQVGLVSSPIMPAEQLLLT